jgi:pimeloyl-ACP methyl ester carboxylesterase
MNFSQGCSLTSSLLLYQQAQQPSQPPLFKVAIFICGGVPLDVVEELGVNVTQEARDWDSSSKAQLEARASSAAILREGRERWGAGFDSLESVPSSSSSEAATTAPTNIFGIDFSLVKPELRIRIPTVHVYGARDPRFPASVTLAHFCDSSMRRTFDHGAGHEIPRARPVSERLAELLEWAAMMADRW